MKKLFTFLFFSLVGSGIFAQGSWVQMADFGGTVRFYAAGFSIGTKGYIGTGSNYAGVFQKDFWEYNSVTNAWTQKADFGGSARQTAVGFSIGNKGYIGTGYDYTFKKDFWEWDQLTNTWTQKSDFGGTGRSAATGFSVGSKGYIGTGEQSINVLTKDFWEWDQTTDTWTQKMDFGGTERSAAAGFSIGSKGYIVAGYNLAATKDFWEFDVAANVWTQKSNFPGYATHGSASFSIGTKGYVGTGEASGTPVGDFWEWDQPANVWTQKSNISGSTRYGAVAFSIGGKGYIGVGYNSVGINDFWQYNPWSYGFNASDDSICAGSPVSFTNTTNDPDAYLYEWWFMSPWYADTIKIIDTLSTNLQHTFNVEGMHHIQLFVSDSNGIYLGESSMTDIFVANVDSLSFVISPASCNSSDGAVLVNPSVGALLPYTYLWTNGGSTQNATGLSIGSYSVLVTNKLGCTATDSVAISTNTVVPGPSICMVTVDSISQNNVIMWDKSALAHIDSFIVLRETSTNTYSPVGAVPYDSLSMFVDTVRTKYFPNTGDPNTGTYRYKLQMADSCGNHSILSPYHNTIFIINNSGTFSWPQLYTIEGGSNPVGNYVLMRDNNSTGNWQVVSSVTGTQQTITDPQYATYQATASWRVETQWSISCTPTKINPQVLGFNSSRSNIFSFVNGVDEFYNNPQISISPNPFAETATLHIQNGGSMSYEFKMLDIYGREVMTHIIPKGMDDFKIERNSLACGMYFYKLANGIAIVASGKLIIK